MNKKIILGILIVLALILIVRMFNAQPVAAPTADTNASLSQELSGLDSVDLDTELKAMDTDLGAL
jgi:hypothetical protein